MPRRIKRASDLPTKDGPKRRRVTRRELPEGGYSQWGTCLTHFKRERTDRLIGLRTAEQLAEVGA